MTDIVIRQVRILPNGDYIDIEPPRYLPDNYVPEGTMSAAEGRARWATLHLRALMHDGGDDSAWLERFSAEIPRSCCGVDWHHWITANPPRWGDYFAWTVEAHNAINARLGKPRVALEAAREHWLMAA